MFGTRRRSYAAGMERNASATNHPAFAQPSIALRSVPRACVSFGLRYLRAIAEGYVKSCACNPYWVGAVPFPESRRNEARMG